MKSLIKKEYSNAPTKVKEFLDKAIPCLENPETGEQEYGILLLKLYKHNSACKDLSYYTKQEIENIFKKTIENYLKTYSKKD